MNEVKHIAIGKIGKSVRFKGIKIAQGAGADITWYSLIARMNPTYKFYFIGPNELHKLKQDEYDRIFPHRNVFSVYKYNEKKADVYEDMWNEVQKQGIKFDFGILLMGAHADKSVKNFLKYENGKFYTPLTCFCKYCGSYTYMLNRTMMPWYSLSEDARYITYHVKDLVNPERFSFSQINMTLPGYKHISSIENTTIYKDERQVWKTWPVEAIYAGIEKIFFNSINPNFKDEVIDSIPNRINAKGNPIIILSNGCGTGEIDCSGNNSSRLGTYKKWVIDNFKGTEFDGVKIYGKWDADIYEKEPQIEDKLLVDLKPQIAQSKYTLVYSQIPGFVTIKAWEMITLGLIPFLHPDYDKYHLLGLPEYVYLKDENDFIRKVRELENDPKLYKKVLEDCLNCIDESDLDGSKVNNFVFGMISEDLGFDYEAPAKGVPAIFDRFDKDFTKRG